MADAATTSKDKEKERGIDRRLFRRIVGLLRPYRGWVFVALLGVIASAVLGPLRPRLIQIAIDRFVVPGDVQGLDGFLPLILGLLLAESFLAFFNGYLTQWIGQRAILDLRTRVFNHLTRQPLAYFDRTPIGRLITRTTSDVESLSDVLSAGVVTILGDLLRLVFIAYFMLTLDWRLALVALSVLPAMIWATAVFRRKVREQYRETRTQVARLNSFLQEHVAGMSVVQLFNREAEEARRFAEVNDAHRVAQNKTVFYFALFWPAVETIASVALGLVLWAGGLMSASGVVTLGTLIAFIQYVRQFFEPIRNLSDQYNTLQSAMAGAERIFEVLDHDEALPEKPDAHAPGVLRGEIEFRDVWFAYDAAEAEREGREPHWILRGVSFRVPAGTSTAIVGATGAGKTTIISLLLRFYDVQRGAVLVDGVDVRDYRIRALRRHVGLVLQDVFLFSGSVEQNVSLGDPAVTPERVRQAAAEIGADRFIERLPQAYAQDVKERGATLSHGQRQMLSFVRALVYDPAVLVLDEATSSVDTETEEAIQAALVRLMEGRTSVVIAHRLSTIQHADQILVMHRGEVRERGTHAELLAHGGLYRRLYELQYRDQEARGDGAPARETAVVPNVSGS
ncbi:MAG TPA: ABC transporter ATP-binding protein [Rhodothermales bacterium]|nr:ABC transporter ATP-binding protein [Rhodothermales bacterium]